MMLKCDDDVNTEGEKVSVLLSLLGIDTYFVDYMYSILHCIEYTQRGTYQEGDFSYQAQSEEREGNYDEKCRESARLI